MCYATATTNPKPAQTMSTPSKTPRTDAMREKCIGIAPHADWENLSGEIETELVAERRKVEKLREAIGNARAELAFYIKDRETTSVDEEILEEIDKTLDSTK